MSAISTNYREVSPLELPRLALQLADAWKDKRIPLRQFQWVVESELQKFREGRAVVPFDALAACLKVLPPGFFADSPRLLDIGASSGYYREVLKIAKFNVQYTGMDFSPAFKDLAETLYPGIDFRLGDACHIPLHDDAYDVVLSSACIMHLADYEQAIREAARVSRRSVIFHRTPIVRKRPTTAFVKDAYQVPCIEWHFNEGALLELFARCGLNLIYERELFFSESDDFGHACYVLAKEEGIAHYSV